MALASTIAKFAHLKIPLENVAKATNNFHDDNIIGRGGFGPAYKGKLLRPGESIKIVALRLDRRYGEGDVEFWTEVSMLSNLEHPNLVSLIGFSDEKDEKIIVITYAANGSLKEHLNNPNLSWTQRLRISIDVAHALSYLSYDEGRDFGVIHRNINSSTILLDENWEAKLSGFKVAIKQSANQMDQVLLTEQIGTIGYIDPSMEMTRGATHKSDIYSFGVVLFEMFCGREAFVKKEANRFLAPMARYHFENKTLKDIMNPDLFNQLVSRGSLFKYLRVAYSCIKKEQSKRPDMDYIVSELENALKLQLRLENLQGNNLEHLRIPLSVILSATFSFLSSHEVMDTTYCRLYEVQLDHFNKDNYASVDGANKRDNTVIIKRFLPRDDEKGEEVFYSEFETLACAKHPNIVTLIGFCVERYEMILVLENVSKGDLHSYLDNHNKMLRLTWKKRLMICIDVANALNYLHSELMIINRNINPHGIWLDENWRAKIVDFGLSVLLPPNQKDEALYHNVTGGLTSYIDPEYEKTGKLTIKSDVYSFGVVLCEILSGKHTLESLPLLTSNDRGLASMARRCFRTGALDLLIDPYINKAPNKDSLDAFCEITYQCIAETQSQRPTMEVVVNQLVNALCLQKECPDVDQVVDEIDKICEKPGGWRDEYNRLLHLYNLLESQTQHQDFGPDELVGTSYKFAPPLPDALLDELKKESDELTPKIPDNNLEHLKICLEDIKLATDNFSKTYKIRDNNRYYAFYRAELKQFDNGYPSSVEDSTKKLQGEPPKRQSTIVIKRIDIVDDMEDEELQGDIVFKTEIQMLASVQHPNIATLVGFFYDSCERILVLEDVSNRYLGHYLQEVNGMRILNWEKRLKICIDVANALNYLHSEMEDKRVIINRDINSYNIGLDKNWRAKIVDLGLSVFLPPNQEDVALYHGMISNTFYLDPEYDKTGRLKRESDVYSFGVVLFEILCGRLAYDPIYLEESNKGLAYVARQCFRNGTLNKLMDPNLKDEIGEKSFILNRGPNKDSLKTFTGIAFQCVAATQDERPTMNVILMELEKALFLQENNDNPKISLEDIKLATQNFHDNNCIGGGGFGKVYKGNLQVGKELKTIVAKRLNTEYGQGEKQFLSELQILWEYKHENIIGLVGYCDEKDEKIIVYEYASRGSLDRYLNNASVTWMKRLNICIDIASALDFLHGGVAKQAKVIHRDIKTANILVNDDWKGILADFGLSLISPINKEIDYVIDHACGTPGYLDPLYRKTGFLTIESDVYSFGVVLFEILCGRSTYSIHKHEGEFLSGFIKNRFEVGKQHDVVVFEPIREQIEPKSLTTFQEIAYQCLTHEREKRPTTKEVLRELKKALEFQISGGD